ncbi:MAG: hypothetical protein ACFB02_17250 [Mastigocoleus sp.]
MYGPILDISIFPYQNNGYDVKILCHGDWQRGEECSPTRVWVSVTAYENTNARNPVIFNTEFAGGGTEAWHLKIFNKDGGEEYYKIYSPPNQSMKSFVAAILKQSLNVVQITKTDSAVYLVMKSFPDSKLWRINYE